MKVLVTGVAGFIGMHVGLRLLERGDEVVGIDNLNDYYDPRLKRERLARLKDQAGFRFVRMDIAATDDVAGLFAAEGFKRVVHLAAQAGVRYSIINPHAYAQANLVGFLNVLEACRHNAVEHLVYASSSSVYGGSPLLPFSEANPVDHPVSLYAATKKSNELMAHTYSHLYALPTTGLRFFTVYGPWGRPDMAPYLFTDAIANGRPINVFNGGDMRRDFTYIDDIAEAVASTLDRVPELDEGYDRSRPDPGRSFAPFRLFNIGNSTPIPLDRFIAAVESALGRKAIWNLMPMQPGDVPVTHADTGRLESWTGFKPKTSIEVGINRFVDWYRTYCSLTANRPDPS